MKLKRNFFVKTVMLVISLYCFIQSVTLYLDNNSKMDQVLLLNAQIQEYELYIDELQTTLDAPMDDEYVAAIAREKLGLRYPQEVVFYSDDSE